MRISLQLINEDEVRIVKNALGNERAEMEESGHYESDLGTIVDLQSRLQKEIIERLIK